MFGKRGSSETGQDSFKKRFGLFMLGLQVQVEFSLIKVNEEEHYISR